MSSSGLELVEVGDDRTRLDTFSDLMLEITPSWSRTTEQMLATFELDPTQRRVIARLDGAFVGFATVGRVWVLPIDNPTAWCELGVQQSHRGRGIGTALLAWSRETAPTIGKTQLMVPCSSDRPDGIEFLQARGFEEYDRMAGVHLDLAGMSPPDVAFPAGVRLTSLGAEPDLRASAYEAAVEIFADLPDPVPVSAGTYEEWRLRDVDTPDGPLDGYLLAVEDDAVVGYCRLLNEQRGRVIGHAMTGVRRSHRGRGIAQALKHAAIAWAIEHGAEEMSAENAIGNEPMRAINRKLGFVAAPDFVEMKGSAVEGQTT